jgi:hypothetical protein
MVLNALVSYFSAAEERVITDDITRVAINNFLRFGI